MSPSAHKIFIARKLREVVPIVNLNEITTQFADYAVFAITRVINTALDQTRAKSAFSGPTMFGPSLRNPSNAKKKGTNERKEQVLLKSTIET